MNSQHSRITPSIMDHLTCSHSLVLPGQRNTVGEDPHLAGKVQRHHQGARLCGEHDRRAVRRSTTITAG